MATTLSEEEKQRLARRMGSGDLDAIEEWFDAHPEAHGDELVSYGGGSRENLYMFLMFDAQVDADSPLLQKVVSRKPDPTVRNGFGRTALEIVTARAAGPARGATPDFWTRKVALARRVEDAGVKALANVPSKIARVSKQGLGLPLELENRIAEFGSGKTGSVPVQLSKLRASLAGQPGVSSSKGGRRRKRKTRRRTARSIRGRSY